MLLRRRMKTRGDREEGFQIRRNMASERSHRSQYDYASYIVDGQFYPGDGEVEEQRRLFSRIKIRSAIL